MGRKNIKLVLETPFGEMTLSSYAAEPFEKSHPNNHERRTHFSNNKPLTIKINGKTITGENFDVWMDERSNNTMSIHAKYQGAVVKPAHQAIFDWLYHYHAEMKRMDPLYGTWDYGKNYKSTGKEGQIPLYMHDFFGYLKENHRGAKLDRLLTECENTVVSL